MAKVLLVLGNGFDLACGLESSFENYLNSDYYKECMDDVISVNRFIEDCFRMPSVIPPFDVQPLRNLFQRLTFWDLFFALPKVKCFPDIKLWYDFEKKLRGFLTEVFHDQGTYRSLDATSWNTTEMQRSHEKRHGESTYNLALRLYLEYSGIPFEKNRHFDRGKVFDSLFFDLRKYEEKFGKYIGLQQTIHVDYVSKAQALIDALLGNRDDELVYINTFNYSDLSVVLPNKDVWHINGDMGCPIFGVDYKDIKIEDNRYKFTKTFRRLELNERKHPLCSPEDKDYSKVVVFGHSLNEQDYNYFFALFNRLNLSNERGRRKGYTVEFAYSPHHGQTSEEARVTTMTRALALLQSYNDEILHEEGFRLMDILYFSGAIKFREV